MRQKLLFMALFLMLPGLILAQGGGNCQRNSFG